MMWLVIWAGPLPAICGGDGCTVNVRVLPERCRSLAAAVAHLNYTLRKPR